MGAADRLHLTEHLTRTGADTIDYQMTIDDPTTRVKPWTAVVRLRAAQDNVQEFACHEGNVDVLRRILGGARAEEAAQR